MENRADNQTSSPALSIRVNVTFSRGLHILA